MDKDEGSGNETYPLEAICTSRIREMSKNLFAKAVQDAASGSEDGPNRFRGRCYEVVFFSENKVETMSQTLLRCIIVVFGHLVLII